MSAYNVGDLGSIPGLGRSPGEGNGNPLQYPCLENLMDRGAWWTAVHGVAKFTDYKNQIKFRRPIMARKRKRSKKQSFSKKMTSLAFSMGQVQRGLKNPDSRIRSSYEAGLNSSPKAKKPLF